MKTHHRIKLILVMSLLLTGCMLEQRVIDEISLARAISFDLTEEGKMRVTASFPTFIEQGQENVLVKDKLEGVGDSTMGAIINLQQKSQKRLELGQIRSVFISQELAESGLKHYLDSLYRDPSIGTRVYLIIVEGNAGELLGLELSSGEQPAVYLAELIEQNIEYNILPYSNFHLFLRAMYGEARDPFLPLVKKNDHGIEIVGSALFEEQFYRNSIGVADSFMLKLMTSRLNKGMKQFTLSQEEDSYVVLEKLSSHFEREIDLSGPEPVVTMKITLDGKVLDYTGEGMLRDQLIRDEITNTVASDIQENCLQLLRFFQENHIDPVAIGELYRSQVRDWDKEEWKTAIYPTVQFEVEVEVSLVQVGSSG